MLDLSVPQRLRTLLQAASYLRPYRDRFHEVGLDKTCLTQGSNEQLFSAFLRLPVVTKEELRQSPAQFLHRVDQITYRGVTSGTTDQALIYFRDSLWNQKRQESLRRFLSWWGITNQIPVVNVNSRLFPLREVDYSLTGMLDSALVSWIVSISSERAIALRGFPSRLCELALLIPRTLSSVVAVICTGELLFPHQRRLLEDTFFAPVVDEYGSQECGIHGFSCPLCGDIHIDTERCFAETKDQQLIVTDLYSDCMPLIRYGNGDRAELFRDSNCQNGSVSLRSLGREGEKLIRVETYPLCSGISYYRSLPTFQEEIAIAYLSHTSESTAQTDLKAALDPLLPPHKPIYWQRFESPQDFYYATLPNGGGNAVQLNAFWLTDAEKLTSEKKAEGLLEIINNRRWIFYRLPTCLEGLVTQLERRSDCLDGENSLLIDRLILLMRVLAYQKDKYQELILTVEMIWTRHRHSIHQRETNALYLDLLSVALFFLPLEWFTELSAIQINGRTPVDTISYRLIFTVLRQAIQKARSQVHPPLITRLTPLLPLFVSDLDLDAKALPSILVHWSIILDCIPSESLEGLTVFSRPTRLKLREKFLQGWGKTNGRVALALQDRHLINFQNLDAAELTELLIQLVVSDIPFDPSSLLKVIESFQSSDNEQSSSLTNALRFVPFMRFLSKRFLEQGDHETAYRCLLVSKDIGDQQDDYESSTWGYNFKQKIFW